MLYKWAAAQQNDMHPTKTQISPSIRPVWSESSLSAWRNLGTLAIQWVHSEDSDQTGQIPRLIWVFTGRIGHFIGFVVQRLKSYLLDYCRETDQVGIWWWFRDNQHMSQLKRLKYFSSVNSILQMHMRSHSVGLDVWFLIYCHTSCVRIAKALARLCGCTG